MNLVFDDIKLYIYPEIWNIIIYYTDMMIHQDKLHAISNEYKNNLLKYADVNINNYYHNRYGRRHYNPRKYLHNKKRNYTYKQYISNGQTNALNNESDNNKIVLSDKDLVYNIYRWGDTYLYITIFITKGGILTINLPIETRLDIDSIQLLDDTSMINLHLDDTTNKWNILESNNIKVYYYNLNTWIHIPGYDG